MRLGDVADYIYSQVGIFPLAGIDGWTLVGKTTIAKQMAIKFGVQYLDLDDFLAKGKDMYVDALDLPRLKSAIEDASLPLYISGVCLLEVCARLEITLDAHIYLKRMGTETKIWQDEDEALGSGLKAYERAGCQPSPLLNEMHNYHLKYQPHVRADHVIEIACGASD